MTARSRPSARCRALLLELSRYLDNDLTAAQRRAVERHVRDCSCCGTMAARLRTTVDACRAEGTKRPPRAVMARAAERIRSLLAREGSPTAEGRQRRRQSSRVKPQSR